MKQETLKPIDYCERTIAFKHFIEAQWIELAGQLKEIRDKSLYQGRWDSFEDFLADPSMAMDRSTASKMITIHEKFILEYKIPHSKIAQVGGWSKVAEILPAVTDKKSAVRWLEDAASLSKSDLRKQVKEEENPNSLECKHKRHYQIVMQCCRDCGHKEVVKGGE